MSFRLNKQERSDVRWWARYGARWVIGIVVAIVLLSAVIGLGWHRYYGRARLDVDARNRRASFERQDTDRQELLKLYDQYTGTDRADTAHREALKERMCAIYGEVRGSLGNYPSLQTQLSDCP